MRTLSQMEHLYLTLKDPRNISEEEAERMQEPEDRTEGGSALSSAFRERQYCPLGTTAIVFTMLPTQDLHKTKPLTIQPRVREGPIKPCLSPRI